LREDVIGLLKNKPEGVGMGEISRITGYDKDRLKILLKELKDTGVLIIEGKARGMKYILMNDDPVSDDIIPEDIIPEDIVTDNSGNVIRSMIERSTIEQQIDEEDDSEMIQEIIEKGMNILKSSDGYYKLPFARVLEIDFPRVKKQTIRKAVNEIIQRDDVKLNIMTVVYVG